MTLTPGDKLGQYEIVSMLGKGGMGEVYRARDPKLNREVAIKVLPATLAKDADYFARFQREAKTLASLNHPNIASIYGLEANAIVMELIEGDTLRGPLPLAEALPLARQIAEALEAAHEKGIIHRDLKPGNIKVTPDGVVKVLDFGLAKAIAELSSASGADSTTLTLPATAAGVILGTAAYMSPEQAAGKPVDRRADIWSFGVVFYELLTGKRLFSGETVTHTLAAVVGAPIDLALVEDQQAKHLIRRCLDRNIKTRLQHIGEARIAIESYAPGQAQRIEPAKAGWWPWVLAALATLACIAACFGWYSSSTRLPAPRPLMRLDLEVPPGTPLAGVDLGAGFRGNMLALSSDGELLALTLRGADGKVRLHTRLLRQNQAVPLAGTENAYGPFFSPAGDWIGFFAEGKLKKIAVGGGTAVTLCEAPLGMGGSWGDDGNIIAALDIRTVLSRVPSAGGTPVPVTKLNAGEATHRWPQILPGSQAVLFTTSEQTGADYSDANIDVLSLRTGERKTLHSGGFFGRYLAEATSMSGTGHLVYLRFSMAFAVPFHPEKLVLARAPVPILEDVSGTIAAGGDFAFAQNGTFVYLAAKPAMNAWPISWVDSIGTTAQPLHAPLGGYYAPRFSPDGKQLAFAKGNGKGSDIWVKDLDRDTPLRLSFLPGGNVRPLWTPDGKTIVFRSSNSAAPGLYAMRSDGSGEAKRLTESRAGEYPSSFSPDGKHLAIFQTGNGGSLDIFTIPVEADAQPGGPGLRLGNPELFLGTPFAESHPAFSPDGRWLAYESNESGINEVYVRPFLLPGGGRQLVSAGGGRAPLWSRDGRELLFLALDRHVMAASYTARGDSFAAGKPRVWTNARIKVAGVAIGYDLAPDGKRLAAMLADEDEKPSTHLTFLLNFFDELRRKAPTGQ